MNEKLDIDNAVKKFSPNSVLAEQHQKDGGSLYKPDYVDIASRLISAGFSQADLAYAFCVNDKTIHRWRKSHPEFDAAIIEGKEGQKKRLVAKAMQGAGGYEYKTSKRVLTRNAEGRILKDEVREFVNHQPINHNLIIWLLCNISRQLGDGEWQSKHTIEVDQKNVTLKIDGAEEFKRITDFAGKYLENRKTVESKEINAVK